MHNMCYGKKITRQYRLTGKMDRKVHQPGRKPQFTPSIREQIRGWLKVQPDLTLVELQEKLLQQQHLQVSLVSIWKALKSCSGLLASMTVEASTDTDVFLAFLDQVLCPQLRAGQIVVMDNLSAHKVAAVRAKIKQILRSLKARTAEALDEAITQALACITAENARGWFQHCGYQITQNVKTV